MSSGVPAPVNYASVAIPPAIPDFFSASLIGGLLITLGLFTRPVAFILAGDVAVAYFMAHAPRGFFPLLNGGELAIVYCFVFLYLFVAGGGVWSSTAHGLAAARRNSERAGPESRLSKPRSASCCLAPAFGTASCTPSTILARADEVIEWATAASGANGCST